MSISVNDQKLVGSVAPNDPPPAYEPPPVPTWKELFTHSTASRIPRLISSYLLDRPSLIACTQVCKAWNVVWTPRIYEQPDIFFAGRHREQLTGFIRFLNAIRKDKIRPKTCAMIKTINIQWIPSSFYVHVPDSFLVDILERCHSLTTISANYAQFLTAKSLKSVDKRFTSVKQLSIANIRCLSTDELLKFLSCFPNVERLDLSQTSNLRDVVIAGLPRSVTSLTALNCTKLTSSGISHFIESRDVRELYIGGCTNVDDHIFATLESCIPGPPAYSAEPERLQIPNGIVRLDVSDTSVTLAAVAHFLSVIPSRQLQLLNVGGIKLGDFSGLPVRSFGQSLHRGFDTLYIDADLFCRLLSQSKLLSVRNLIVLRVPPLSTSETLISGFTAYLMDSSCPNKSLTLDVLPEDYMESTNVSAYTDFNEEGEQSFDVLARLRSWKRQFVLNNPQRKLGPIKVVHGLLSRGNNTIKGDVDASGWSDWVT